MGRITIDQSHSILATLAMNVNWEEVDFEGARLQDLVIRNPKEAGQQFTAFLKNGGRVVMANNFQIWKTIKLGTCSSADVLSQALQVGDFRIGDRGKDILGKPAFKVSPKETSIELVNISVAELGFKDGATRKDIYERAISLGLELCPNEVGPQLRLQYKDQPGGEWLRIAMEPIAGSNGDLYVFDVALIDGGLWVFGYYGNPGSFWYGLNRWVFARRK